MPMLRRRVPIDSSSGPETVTPTSATTLSSDGQWLPPLPSTALDGRAPHPDGALLWVDGHLRLQGALTGGWHTPASAAEPSSPAVHALVMGDALAVALLEARGFTAEEFALSHPGPSCARGSGVGIRRRTACRFVDVPCLFN